MEHVAFVYPCDRKIGRTAVHSLIEQMRSVGKRVDEYNLIDETNAWNQGILDSLWANKREYEVVFVLDLGYLLDDRINKDHYRCPVVLLAGDDPQNFKIPFLAQIKRSVRRITSGGATEAQLNFWGNSVCAKQYDIVFTHQAYAVNWYRKVGVKKVYWLPYWCDTMIHQKRDHIKVEYDVVTVMHPRLRRIATLNFLEANRNFSFSNGVGNYGHDCAEYYQKGKIVFNQSNFDEYTMRIPEAMGCGCFVLTDRISDETGLYEHFKPEVHFDVYRDTVELEQKILHYLRNDQLRETIAREGYLEVHNNHTQKQRVEYIFSKVC